MQKVLEEMYSFVNCISRKEIKQNGRLRHKLRSLVGTLRESDFKLDQERKLRNQKVLDHYLGNNLLDI